MTTDDLAAAVAALRRDELVAFPTETVYGLGARASSPAALRRLYAVKGRPVDHPVIVHVSSADRLDSVAVIEHEVAYRLAAAFWPGSLTLVVARRIDAVDALATGGRPTVGVRVPAHELALELLAQVDDGIAAPSANRFGRVSPTTAAAVRADLGDDVAVVLDGGPCGVGIESTIVDCTRGDDIRVLRLGAVTVDALAEVVGRMPTIVDNGSVAAPGTLPSHYAPRTPVALVGVDAIDPWHDVEAAVTAGARIGVLALATVAVAVTGVTVRWSPESIDDYARDLYSTFRAADTLGLDRLFVVAPLGGGLAAAVRDRVERAAAR